MIKRLPWWAAALVWFVAWHLFLFSHVWRDPTYLVPGPIGDNTVMLWNLAWVKQSLDNGSPGFWMSRAFYPEGFLFLYGTHTWLDGVLGWVASSLLPEGRRGIVLWANLVQLLASTASGLFAMAALRQWGVRRWELQLLAASALAFCAFRMYASVGHYHFFGTQWMLAALWMGARGRRLLRAGWGRSGAGWCVGGGAFIGIAFLNDQTHAVFAAILTTLALVSLGFARTRRSASSFVLLSLAGAGLAALLISAVHLVPMIMAIHSGKFQYRVPLSHERLVDFTSLFLPDNRHPVLGPWLAMLRERTGWIVEEGPYLGLGGYLFLLVGVVGCLVSIRLGARGRRNPWRRVWWATVLGGSFLVLAMGEYLQAGPQRYSTLPGRLLREIPVLNNIRLMQRWVWPALLCLAVAGTLGLSLWRGHRWALGTRAAVLLLAGFICFEAKWRPPPEPMDIIRGDYLNPPGLVEGIRTHYTSGSVLMMPMEHSFTQSNAIQFNVGFDVPMTVAYTARSPWDPTQTPWDGPQWSPEAEAWLRQKQVGLIVFPIEYEQAERNLPAWIPWVRGAQAALPHLVVLDRHGTPVGD